MKRKRIMLIVGICGLCLSGCGKDPLSSQMTEQIKEIGTVELDDEPLIIELERTYSEMTEKQKNQVSNYVDLKNARKELDRIKVDMAKEPPYDKAIELCQVLKDTFADPDDLKLNFVEYNSEFVSGQNVTLYKIDFSGLSERVKFIVLITDVRTEVYQEDSDSYYIWDSFFGETNTFYDSDKPKTVLDNDIIINNLN